MDKLQRNFQKEIEKEIEKMTPGVRYCDAPNYPAFKKILDDWAIQVRQVPHG
jgi:hypothetical protein